MIYSKKYNTKSPIQSLLTLFLLVVIAASSVQSFAQQGSTINSASNDPALEQVVQDLASSEAMLLAPTISVDNPVESAPQELTLSWDGMEDAVTYNLELCSDTDCDPATMFFTGLDNNSIELPSLSEQQYFWRVRGVDANEVSGEYSSFQPLLISSEFEPVVAPITQPLPVADADAKQEAPWFVVYLGPLPWYMWIVILAYLFFILRVATWHSNDK